MPGGSESTAADDELDSLVVGPSTGSGDDSGSDGLGPEDDRKTTGTGFDDDNNELELAATPEFCSAGETLIGHMHTLEVADRSSPTQVRFAYEDTEAGLLAVADEAPNSGVRTQIAEAGQLFLPLVGLLRAADWDFAAIDSAQAAQVLADDSGDRLDGLVEDFEQYMSLQCGSDIETIKIDAAERFEYDLADTPPEPEDDPPEDDGPDDPVAIDPDFDRGVDLGVRGGDVFCRGDRVWLAMFAQVDSAVEDGQFLDRFLQSADIYTSWGERIPADLAVRTLEMTLGYTEVITTFGEFQDVAATRGAYQEWRSSADYREGRREVDQWVAANC